MKNDPFDIVKKYRGGSPKTEPSRPAGDLFEGPIIVVLIRSTVLEAEIWLALEDWEPDPGDTRAVFYGHELEFLKTKTPAELRAIHKVKLTWPGSRVRT